MSNAVLSLPVLVAVATAAGEYFRSLDAILFSILIFCADANPQ